MQKYYLKRKLCDLFYIFFLILLAGIFGYIFITSYIHLRKFIFRQFHFNYFYETVEEKEEIPAECLCSYKNNDYNLCYTLPLNKTIHGRRFNCSYLAYLEKLDLSQPDASKYIDLSTDDVPKPVFVTAFNSDRYDKGTHNIKSVRNFWPDQKIIFYDLGLKDGERKYMQSLCNVEYRKFDFDHYPNHVRKILQWRWKTLIMAETLRDFPAIWWMDVSVRWRNPDLTKIYSLLACRKTLGNKPALNFNKKSLYPKNDTLLENKNLFDETRYKENLKACDKSAWMLHSFAGHGTFSGTHKGMYEFLPTEEEKIRDMNAKMLEANFNFIVRTKEVVERVLKWNVLCALEKDCYAPPEVDSHREGMLFCQFKDKYKDFGDCHRYDQSAINILLLNMNGYDYHFYASEMTDFFKIDRDIVSPVDINELKCTKKGIK